LQDRKALTTFPWKQGHTGYLCVTTKPVIITNICKNHYNCFVFHDL
jgi:hypothetical protein